MMEEYKWPPPEGFRKPCTLRQLQDALASHEILASPVLRCDAQRNLHLRPGGCGGIIPQDQVAAPFLPALSGISLRCPAWGAASVFR